MPTSVPALSLDGVSVSYGHVESVVDVTLTVGRGETVALIGPNGAGKSTLLRAISNQVAKVSGRVRLYDRDITSAAPHRITRAGVVQVPEGRQVVAPLTVEENLHLAARASRRCPRREVRRAIDQVYELFPPLVRLRARPSGLLSGGEQQMVAIGRALVSRPQVLLLDEPSMGLAPVMVETIYTFLSRHRVVLDGAAILLAEQSRIALDVSDRAAVLSRGRLMFTGVASELADDLLTSAYLGTAESMEKTP
ncbi:ABC transporter ATP-binding protein [Streptomyces sp. NPDC058424]|uniref:ABC transporter ATP-binding protein n=1 Tax=Streptomyces sp. NPDC058424 TaxID=3346491 RepID=UPI003665FE3F